LQRLQQLLLLFKSDVRSFFLMFLSKDSIFKEPRTRNATKKHKRQFCYISIVFGCPPEILPMKSWLYFSNIPRNA